ncbi:hypothetical protein D3C81_951550 [compost metagenome]
MQHQPRMRGLHRVADFQEQIEPLAQIRFVPRAVHIQRLAMDELHDQIRMPCRRGAAVIETGDVGMLQAGEDAPLRRKTLGHTRAGFALQELDRHVLCIQAITALGAEHDAHAAAGQAFAQAPRADLVAFGQLRCHGGGEQVFQRRARIAQIACLRMQQLQRFGNDIGVDAPPRQLGLPLRWFEFAHRIKQLTHLLPTITIHSLPLLRTAVSCRASRGR